jgi:hypothetical protein
MNNEKILAGSEVARVTNEQLRNMPYSELLVQAEERINQLLDFTPENVDQALGLMMEICSFSSYVGFRPEKEPQDQTTLEHALMVLKNLESAIIHIEKAILGAYREYIPDITLEDMRNPLGLANKKDEKSSLVTKWNALGFPRGSKEHSKYLAWSWMIEDTLRSLRSPARLPFRIRAIEQQLEKITTKQPE